jgi:hypothetical protein
MMAEILSIHQGPKDTMHDQPFLAEMVRDEIAVKP